MDEQIEILPLLKLNLDEILPIITGYESYEKYLVEKYESDMQTIFTIRLVQLKEPYQKTFEEDFNNDEDFQRYTSFLSQGYSFGAYDHHRLVIFAISEAQPWNRSLQVWEFHVKKDYRRKGIGKALMGKVVSKAIQDQFRIISLETQNTNLNAIRFYRSVGFSLEALDLSLYTNHDLDAGEVAFFMKMKLE